MQLRIYSIFSFDTYCIREPYAIRQDALVEALCQSMAVHSAAIDKNAKALEASL